MQQILLLLAYFLLVVGYSYNKGWFSVGGLLLLISSFGLLLYVFLQKKRRENPISQSALKLVFGAILTISIVLGIDLWNYDMNGFVSPAMVLVRVLMTASLFLSFFYLIQVKPDNFFNKHKFILLFLFALFLRLLMLRIVTVPEVDIFFNLKYRTMELLKLQNPYSLTYNYPKEALVTPSFYPYGPLLFPIVIPFNLLGDPRLMLIASDLVAAFLLYKLFPKKSYFSQIVPLIFLFSPQSLFFASLSAVDNLLITLFVLFFSLYARKKYYPAFLAFALIGGIKHIYAFPVIFSLRHKINRKIVFALLTTFAFVGLIYAFFAWWDFTGLQTGLMGTFTTLTQTWIVAASLSFQAFLVKQTIISPWLSFKPSIIFGLIPFLGISLFLFLKMDKSLLRLSLATALSLFAFIFFAPYALFQYYTVVAGLVLVSLAFSFGRN